MITNGTVTIEDGKKAAEEYAPARKVSVSISFVVPEGVTEIKESELYVTVAGDMANAHVNRLLSRAAQMVPRAETTAAPIAEDPATGRKKRDTKPREKTKAELAAEQGLPGDTVHKGSPPSQVISDELTETVLDQTTGAIKEPAKPAGDDLGDLLGESAPAPVTDAELGKAASAKNGALAAKHGAKYDPTAIRKLVSKYNGEVAGKKLADIPAAKRADFLKELDALI